MTDRNSGTGPSTGRRPRLRERIRFSLVLRLNTSTTLRTLSMFLSLNVLLLVLVAAAYFLHVENQAGQAVLSIRGETRPEARLLLPELLSDAHAYEISIDAYRETWKAPEPDNDLANSPLRKHSAHFPRRANPSEHRFLNGRPTWPIDCGIRWPRWTVWSTPS